MNPGMDSNVWNDGGSWGWAWWRTAKGDKWDNCNRMTIKKIKK